MVGRVEELDIIFTHLVSPISSVCIYEFNSLLLKMSSHFKNSQSLVLVGCFYSKTWNKHFNHALKELELNVVGA